WSTIFATALRRCCASSNGWRRLWRRRYGFGSSLRSFNERAAEIELSLAGAGAAASTTASRPGKRVRPAGPARHVRDTVGRTPAAQRQSLAVAVPTIRTCYIGSPVAPATNTDRRSDLVTRQLLHRHRRGAGDDRRVRPSTFRRQERSGCS